MHNCNSDIKNVAPCAIFIYNRPDHAAKMFEALKANKMADVTDVFIFCDGPKNDDDWIKTEEVRAMAKRVSGFKSITIIERNENLGLAKSIVTGVTHVIDLYGKAIVVEGDLITSIGFLEYMNTALNMYEDDEKVFHIAGYLLPINLHQNYSDTFFFNVATCWGWATWKRAWKYLNTDAIALYEKISSNKALANYFNVGNSICYTDHLRENITGHISTWAVKWHASVTINGGLCLHPKKSLVRNIGFDGSGMHCPYDEDYLFQEITESAVVNRISISEDINIRRKIIQYNKRKQRWNLNLLERILYRIENVLNIR
jgi:hypothetical protein